MKRLFTVISLLAIFACVAKAEIRLPSILGSGMVLQRNSEVRLWGTASEGKTVTVKTSWDGKRYRAKADETGKWSLKVHTGEAGGPYSISISDGQELVLENILLGEVWICAGQSNMEMPLCGFMYQPVENSAEHILYAMSETPNIRMFNVPRIQNTEPQDNCGGEWLLSSPRNVSTFSAVGYLFGKVLTKAMDGIPVGLVSANWGGSRIECWMTEEAIDATKGINHGIAKSGTNATSAPQWLYNGLIHPIKDFKAKGIIWYQGCSNRHNWFDYKKLMVSLVKFWRECWGDEDMPFYFTQLAPYTYDGVDFRSLPLVVEAQYQALAEIPHSGIAATTDLGNRTCIHPAKKYEVAARLAYLALANDYGIDGVPRPAPTYKDMETVDDERRGKMLVLSFNNLSPRHSWNEPDSFKAFEDDGYCTPGGFEIAGEDRVWHPAKASFRWWENKIEVWSGEVENPVAVRYAFRNFPADANVKTTLGQPLVPFRTDDWPVEDIGNINS
ncbi:MAG: sialate O-acetylesterase [Clostridium sp.]|nr:sialate O-acetylesterase [Bacteroides sp.]MCM1197736.1 sialate O-acetylesterase [Clostridium sp.]